MRFYLPPIRFARMIHPNDQSQAEEQTEAPTKKVNTASSGSSSLLVIGIIIVVIIAVILIVLIIIKIRSKAESLMMHC